jgi:hypothetical protein
VDDQRWKGGETPPVFFGKRSKAEQGSSCRIVFGESLPGGGFGGGRDILTGERILINRTPVDDSKKRSCGISILFEVKYKCNAIDNVPLVMTYGMPKTCKTL